MNDKITFRQWRQDYRIDNGVRSGALTGDETRELRQGQREIRQAVREARADGHVDANERQVIRGMQDAASNDIYEAKHNEVRQPGIDNAAVRVWRQDHRIDHGVRSGALTGDETRELRQGQREIRQAVREARADGHVDAGERHAIRGLQDAASQQIYALKHNEARRPDLVVQGPTDNQNPGPILRGPLDLPRRPDLVVQGPTDNQNPGPILRGPLDLPRRPDLVLQGPTDNQNPGPILQGPLDLPRPGERLTRELEALVRSARHENMRG